MQNYELMVVFTPVLSEEEYKTAQKKYTSFVTENGGEVVHENAWGLKSLAYPIQKKTTGLYWVLEYAAPTDFNSARREMRWPMEGHSTASGFVERLQNCAHEVFRQGDRRRAVASASRLRQDIQQRFAS